MELKKPLDLNVDFDWFTPWRSTGRCSGSDCPSKAVPSSVEAERIQRRAEPHGTHPSAPNRIRGARRLIDNPADYEIAAGGVELHHAGAQARPVAVEAPHGHILKEWQKAGYPTIPGWQASTGAVTGTDAAPVAETITVNDTISAHDVITETGIVRIDETSLSTPTSIRRSLRELHIAIGNSVNAAEGPDSLNPPYETGNEADRRQVVSCQPVVSRCNSPEVLEPVERTLDAPAQLVETLAEAERLLPVAAVGNDGLGSALIQFLAQLSTVIGPVAKHAFWRLYAADQARSATGQSCASPPVSRMAMRRTVASASA